MAGIRTTLQNVAGHRLLVVRSFVNAFQEAFGSSYDRDQQFVDLRVTNAYPLNQTDYPCLVVTYTPTRVLNAGVGHEEWFNDNNDILRKWNHSRFEGSVQIDVLALSPLDRDALADACEEIVRFGRLDANLIGFFYSLYNNAPNTPYSLQFSQIMLNADEIQGGGNSESLAPWAPEDQLVFETTLGLEVHGGIYNAVPNETFGYITNVLADSYPQGDQDVELLVGPITKPFPDPDTLWTNTQPTYDADEVTAVADVLGDEAEGDGGSVHGLAMVSATETYTPGP